MSHSLLRNANFLALLLQIDEDLLESARSTRCPHCGGVLHRADYPRKPRGSSAQWASRFSLCCDKEGCRKRKTPPSVRYLGRKVYLGAMVVLATFLVHGGTERRLNRLQELLEVPRATLRRWRTWWTEEFASSPFWASARGMFATPIAAEDLPGGILRRMGFEEDCQQGMARLLRFMSPITAGAGLANYAN